MLYSKREVDEQMKKLKKADNRKWTDWERSFFASVEDSKAADLSEKQREKISAIYDRYYD